MKYKSRYSPGKDVTIQNLIIEIICENKAKKENKELPTFFWKLKEWASYFKSQLRKCHSLCKKHTAAKVLAFVKEKNIYSLHPKWIDTSLQTYDYSEKPTKEESIEIIDKKEIVTPTKKISWIRGL